MRSQGFSADIYFRVCSHLTHRLQATEKKRLAPCEPSFHMFLQIGGFHSRGPSPLYQGDRTPERR
jgi:hypothetical protein